MKISTIGKKQVTIILFCFYFIIYAISPLVFTVSDKLIHERHSLTGKAASNTKSIHVLLWDFDAEGYSFREAAAHDHGNMSVLFKQKRALVPEITSVKLFLFENTSIPRSNAGPLEPATHGLTITPSDIQDIHKGFYPIYAGHSPPFTS
jgi:hypothetical protein